MRNKQRGFGFVEAAIAIAVFAILGLIIFDFYTDTRSVLTCTGKDRMGIPEIRFQGLPNATVNLWGNVWRAESGGVRQYYAMRPGDVCVIRNVRESN